MALARSKLLPCGLLLPLFLAGCGSASTVEPLSPTFSSTPVTAAEEGMPYAYQLAATSPDMTAVSFALASGPAGASLSANTLRWTPTREESRVANQFSVTAITPGGGRASQAWSVTPTGSIQIKAVTTYWTPTVTVDIPRVWLANIPYPAALVPQSDGSLTRLQGAANPDGTFSIPDVPGGYFWLQLAQQVSYWTHSSDFDAGEDIVGSPIQTTSQSTTTINISVTGLDPVQPQDLFEVQSNERNFQLGLVGGGFFGGTTLNFVEKVTSNFDFSQINTVFYNQYEPVTSGTFSGLALGPALMQSNVAITNGAVNNIGGLLQPSPTASVPLNINGSAWAKNFQNVAPAAVSPLLTNFSVSAQP